MRESGAYTRREASWKMGICHAARYMTDMTEPSIQNFHAHIYYDAEEVELAKALAAAAQERFGVPVGHFHLRPIGPHRRGSCQLTVPRDQFGDFAQWVASTAVASPFSPTPRRARTWPITPSM